VVIAADRTPFRLGLAEKMGASPVVNVDETPDTAGWFVEHNEGFGFDVVFEMSGSPRAIADSFLIARNGGRVILFGIPSRPVEIDVAEALIFKNLNVLALNGRKIFETWYRTRWLLESGVVDVRPLITKELPLEEYETAFALLAAGEACKIVLYPGGRAPAVDTEQDRASEKVAADAGRWQHR
jgi:threonine 3-dehydrogenase